MKKPSSKNSNANLDEQKSESQSLWEDIMIDWVWFKENNNEINLKDEIDQYAWLSLINTKHNQQIGQMMSILGLLFIIPLLSIIIITKSVVLALAVSLAITLITYQFRKQYKQNIDLFDNAIDVRSYWTHVGETILFMLFSPICIVYSMLYLFKEHIHKREWFKENIAPENMANLANFNYAKPLLGMLHYLSLYGFETKSHIQNLCEQIGMRTTPIQPEEVFNLTELHKTIKHIEMLKTMRFDNKTITTKLKELGLHQYNNLFVLKEKTPKRWETLDNQMIESYFISNNNHGIKLDLTTSDLEKLKHYCSTMLSKFENDYFTQANGDIVNFKETFTSFVAEHQTIMKELHQITITMPHLDNMNLTKMLQDIIHKWVNKEPRTAIECLNELHAINMRMKTIVNQYLLYILNNNISNYNMDETQNNSQVENMNVEPTKQVITHQQKLLMNV